MNWHVKHAGTLLSVLKYDVIQFYKLLDLRKLVTVSQHLVTLWKCPCKEIAENTRFNYITCKVKMISYARNYIETMVSEAKLSNEIPYDEPLCRACYK